MAASDLVVLLSSAMNHKVSDKGMVTCGIQAEYSGGKDWYNNKINQYALVWNGSVESALNGWLTARAGLSKVLWARAYWETSTWGDPGLDYTSSDYSYNDLVQFNLGASINVENWTLDLNIDPASFENAIANPAPGAGIMFFGGYNSNGGVLAVTSADLRYKF
jgi:hypothetical protein